MFMIALALLALTSLSSAAAVPSTSIKDDCNGTFYRCNSTLTAIEVCIPGAGWRFAASCGGATCALSEGGSGVPHCYDMM